jgi:antitoxin YefM
MKMSGATISYSQVREHLAEVWDTVESTREPTIVQRRGHENIAVMPADELAGLLETAHLLRSPANAKRLLAAISRALAGKTTLTTLEEVRRKLGVSEEA